LVAVCVVAFILTEGDRRMHAAEPTEQETTYYLGESRMMSPDGKIIRTSLSLVKRVVSKKDSRIEEHVLSVGEKDSKAFVATLAVKDAKFSVSEKSGSFTGDGELVGEAWKWTAWKSVTKLAGGAGTVTSEDKLTERGISAKKTFTGADGKVALRFEEELTTISRKTYEILYARLAPEAKQ
jgi:hypothetical protein